MEKKRKKKNYSVCIEWNHHVVKKTRKCDKCGRVQGAATWKKIGKWMDEGHIHYCPNKKMVEEGDSYMGERGK